MSLADPRAVVTVERQRGRALVCLVGSSARSARVSLVRRVPKQKTSQRRSEHGIFSTAFERSELVTSMLVPSVSRAADVKHKHPASGYAVAAVAAAVAVEGGSCSRAQIVVGGVTGTPVEAAAAAEKLVGAAPAADAIAAAAALVTRDGGIINASYVPPSQTSACRRGRRERPPRTRAGRRKPRLVARFAP